MSLFLDDVDIRLYHGDALGTVRQMLDESVDCVVTSPPYWGLRDYGTDGQMGLEETPDLFVAGMVELFREIRRVLAPHGTCWVNLGDSFNDKQLVGAPWRVAFALQADGWWLRSAITWCKPNCMPEPVTDRPTKATEMVFLLTKAPRYFYDMEAVREPHAHDGRKATKVVGGNGSIQHRDGERWPGTGRNQRDWWQIATQPYPEAHFATYPEELARRCILAGCPVRVCLVCGKPSERIVERESVSRPDLQRDHPEWRPSRYDNGKAGDPQAPGPGQRFSNVPTVGWSDCGHNNWRPGTVLDPFIGSGTTAKVARDHQRHAIGIDLNLQYLELAARRLQQLSLLT